MENLGLNIMPFYKGKKVFVTGHTGFKGTWLMAWLQEMGAEVKGYALAPETEDSLFDRMLPHISCESVIADIRDRSRLSEEILTFKPDLVFHLAAQPLVRRSYRIPSETFEVNVVGTANLLEVVRHIDKKCAVIVVTTDKVYENKEQNVLFREEDTLGGYDPYSASKACTEMVASSFRNSFFHPQKFQHHLKAIATARAGNVIGGGDFSEDRIIPDIVKALKNGKYIEVRNPHAVRPWQHVLEPLGGYLLLGKCLYESPVLFSGAYNFGPIPADHLTVQELVTKAIGSWGGGNWQDNSNPDDPHEAGVLMLNIEKAENLLNWKPKLNASEAIGWTIDWYKQPASSIPGFTTHQIREYQQL